ncbi:MAG: hypothetical protein ABH860_04610, partial [bacterium]
MVNGKQKKWHETNTAIILALIIFPPAGIYLLWKSDWDQRRKWWLTGIFTIYFMLSVATNLSKETDKTKPAENVVPVETAAQNSLVKNVPEEAPVITTRHVTSLHQAYIGHWKWSGMVNSAHYSDYPGDMYITELTYKVDIKGQELHPL